MKKTRAQTEGFSMRPEQMAILRKIAKKEGRYLSSLVREAVDDWLLKKEAAQP